MNFWPPSKSTAEEYETRKVKPAPSAYLHEGAVVKADVWRRAEGVPSSRPALSFRRLSRPSAAAAPATRVIACIIEKFLDGGAKLMSRKKVSRRRNVLPNQAHLAEGHLACQRKCRARARRREGNGGAALLRPYVADQFSARARHHRPDREGMAAKAAPLRRCLPGEP